MRKISLWAPVCLPALLGASGAAGQVELHPPPLLEEVERQLPDPSSVHERGGFRINTASRAAATDFYNEVYMPALALAPGWTGNLPSCVAGMTSKAYLNATFEVINYFRASAGLLGDIKEIEGGQAAVQEAALMMSAEEALNHFPDPSFACFTAGGALAAGKSNLVLDIAGPGAIRIYMVDPGVNNGAVGHRRWITYPPQMAMASGSVGDGTGGAVRDANVLQVISPFGPRPLMPEWVAWPPAGFVPYQIFFDPTFQRWSLSRNSTPGADFSAATVQMTFAGAPVNLTQLPVTTGFGDHTLVWEPMLSGAVIRAGMTDRKYRVTVRDIRIGGVEVDHSYDVTVFDPGVAVPDTSPCRADQQTACLLGDRYEVRALQQDFSNPAGRGKTFTSEIQQYPAISSETDQSVAFYTFQDGNVELFVKMNPGCGLPSGHPLRGDWLWVTGSTNAESEVIVTDTWTGMETRIDNPKARPFRLVFDTKIFDDCDAPPVFGSCVRNGTTACLLGGRYMVAASQWDFSVPGGRGNLFSGKIQRYPGVSSETDQSVAFYSFTNGNVEFFVKMNPGCGGFPPGHSLHSDWLWVTGATTAQSLVTIRDTRTGKIRAVTNQKANPFSLVFDTTTFGDCDA